MFMLAMITLLSGVLLGMRFKFLVLVPGMVFAAAVILAVGVAHSEEAGSIALATLIAAICLQAGYLGGLFAHHGAVMIRAARMRKAVPQARGAVSGHAQ